MLLHFYFWEDVCDLALFVDDESRSFDAHILLTVHGFLFPHPIGFDDVLLRQVAVDAEQIGDLLRSVAGNLRRHGVTVEVGDAQDIEHQQAVIGDDGAARFGNDRRFPLLP